MALLIYPMNEVNTVPAILSAGATPDERPHRLVTFAPMGDYIHGGKGVIQGFVERKDTPANVPLRRRVRLVREIDGMTVRETWSDATSGAYSFPSIAEQYTYTVLAYDHEHNYRAVLADNLTPEVMP